MTQKNLLNRSFITKYKGGRALELFAREFLPQDRGFEPFCPGGISAPQKIPRKSALGMGGRGDVNS